MDVTFYILNTQLQAVDPLGDHAISAFYLWSEGLLRLIGEVVCMLSALQVYNCWWRLVADGAVEPIARATPMLVTHSNCQRTMRICY